MWSHLNNHNKLISAQKMQKIDFWQKKTFTLYLSMISQQRDGFGKFGIPSNINVVVPLHNGP